MLSKNQIKFINSLHNKKYRNKYGFFIAEGIKVVNELLDSNLELHELYATEDFNINLDSQTQIISENELKKISNLKSPNKVLAIFKIPETKKLKTEGLIVALDCINDPGNLGTIIRLCDWFGVEQLVCSKDTVDCYNSKVVQSTMGSLSRVEIIYTNLEEYLDTYPHDIYGADMDGEIIYSVKIPENALLIMGNEANGLSEKIEQKVTKTISIPRFGNLQVTESLNVATATSILLNEFRRNTYSK
ncbi:TrmH family RNA methyltransferase [Aureivirga sp. CE67]|uniref:TrmH family RNA methyltransferase n=1 Tax=Aureivirga sp. CE67 TaxID=1788983 RepID=UPI0018C9983E|nr:RNA methyltransferase [Aureivirga sp. CE67]